MSREITVSGTDTASTIPEKWSKLGLRKKCETFCGKESHKYYVNGISCHYHFLFLFFINACPCFRVKAAGIRCPTPLLLRMHVLVMEFIGKLIFFS